MYCVSAEGGSSLGCPGRYAPEHEAAWKRLTDFVHGETTAKICCPIGHSGRTGTTQLGWVEMDAPLPAGNGHTALAPANPSHAHTHTRTHTPQRDTAGS